jgi:phytoene dehydrogenase-like protein
MSNQTGTSTQPEPVDCLVIGAGHNGLATGLVLARNGHQVLLLEKNNYVGGMGGTREILKGCRNEVGASCLFPLSREIKEYFDFESHGVELLPLPVMAVNLTGADGRPLIFFKNPLKLSFNILRSFGPGAMLGFIRLMKFCEYPARVLDRFTARKAPRRLEDLIAEADTPVQREHLELAFKGSAMDIIDRFFPDPVKHRELRASMAFASVQATYKGPYTPGSGLCLIYTMAQEGSEGLMQRVRGGIGRLSESLAQQIEELGGEVRLKQQVTRILVEQGRAVGVELKNGQQIRARTVISNLDKQATFNRLLSGHELAVEDQQRVDAFTHRGRSTCRNSTVFREPASAAPWCWSRRNYNAVTRPACAASCRSGYPLLSRSPRWWTAAWHRRAAISPAPTDFTSPARRKNRCAENCGTRWRKKSSIISACICPTSGN